jgi:uncharacterized membrane protein YeaQ/YmgE (transglycosylase-associated protein family)
VVGLIIGYIIVGLIVGALARLVVPGRNPIGLLMTILLGIVGAIAGGLIAHAIGLGAILTFVISVAVAALLVYFISGSRSRTGMRV